MSLCPTTMQECDKNPLLCNTTCYLTQKPSPFVVIGIPAAKEVAGEDVLTPDDIKEGLRESFFKSTGLQYADRLINYATWLESKIVEYRQSHPVNTGDGWVKVEDGLPEITMGTMSDWVLTFDRSISRIDKAFYSKVTGFQAEHGEEMNVTHWQPLPLPPVQ